MESKELISIRSSIQSYSETNRDKLDEAMVSLRFMKEVDVLLDNKNQSNKTLADSLGYSESYISQLMSGVKKINTSFINKLEKAYDMEVKFEIKSKKEEMLIPSASFMNIQFLSTDRDSCYEKVTQFYNSEEFVEFEEVETVY